MAKGLGKIQKSHLQGLLNRFAYTAEMYNKWIYYCRGKDATDENKARLEYWKKQYFENSEGIISYVDGMMKRRRK